ncbi:MAG: hypothetical protein GY820_02605 [Gammaproteobacteria bacterium]|nr:hypothetical protein [Gammaproteobacteria bacterium]
MSHFGHPYPISRPMFQYYTQSLSIEEIRRVEAFPTIHLLYPSTSTTVPCFLLFR